MERVGELEAGRGLSSARSLACEAYTYRSEFGRSTQIKIYHRLSALQLRVISLKTMSGNHQFNISSFADGG
jgi:hypothetical protein